jgi:hypothetical protein
VFSRRESGITEYSAGLGDKSLWNLNIYYMKKISTFEGFSYIREAEEAPVNSSKYTELKDEVKSLIEKTIKNSGGEYASFVEELVKNPEDVKIEGLINDADLYDFYLKYRNDIDELLNDQKFFGNAPSALNSIGLYDYLIKGTQKAIEEAVKILSEEK